jgi:hypothetical protein
MRWTSILLLLALCASVNAAPKKKLIEFGWDEPDPAFMREHAQQLDNSPFDGCVFHVDARRANGSRANFTWDAWSNEAFTKESLQPAIQDLKDAKLRRCTESFVRFNTSPGKLDWFDDHTAISNNCYLAAWFAHEAKIPGILFDIEQYDGQLFDFRKQRDGAQKGWEAYAAQVRLRGRESMQAFQAAYPNVTLFLTFGYSLPWAESGNGKNGLTNCHYGLLAPFIDGMLEVAENGVKLVDGNELAYGYNEPERFTKSYQTMKQELLPIVRHPEKYARHFSLGFGLWMDRDWRKHGWDTNDFAKNYFNPQTFEASVRKSLEVSDEYVWIYTETPRWWSKEGTAVKLPAAYDAAVRRARESR